VLFSWTAAVKFHGGECPSPRRINACRKFIRNSPASEDSCPRYELIESSTSASSRRLPLVSKACSRVASEVRHLSIIIWIVYESLLGYHRSSLRGEKVFKGRVFLGMISRDVGRRRAIYWERLALIADFCRSKIPFFACILFRPGKRNVTTQHSATRLM